MKVKVKITVEQFAIMLGYVQQSTYEKLNELQVLNIRLFLPIGLKKLIDCKPVIGNNNNAEKLKSFSIELNQYTAIMELLTIDRNNLDPYTLAIFLTLQNQHRNLLTLS